MSSTAEPRTPGRMARLAVRWLGAGGIELRCDESILAIDPFVTRPPLRQVLWGRVQPDPKLVADTIPRCDFVLVSHAHYDHVLDVPEIVRQTGALAHGSPNTCRLLTALGTPGGHAREIAAMARMALGPFEVDVLPAEHSRFMGLPPWSGALPQALHPPLRASDYRLDLQFSFRVSAGGVRVLDWCGQGVGPAPEADVLWVMPHYAPGYYSQLLSSVHPRVVIPCHWDDFFRPLSHPAVPSLEPPRWALPPSRRMNLERFRRIVAAAAPGVTTAVLERLEVYWADDLVSGRLPGA